MANIKCIKCGITGDSKCPFCRNVRAEHDGKLGMVDTIMSYRLKIFDDKIEIKLPDLRDDVGKLTGEREPASEVLELIVSLINDAVADGMSLKDVCKVVGCVHEWDFLPGQYSRIGCGHRAAPDYSLQSHDKSAEDFKSVGWDPDELCECGDLLKAHHDNLECAACECTLYRPAWLDLLPGKPLLDVLESARRYCLEGPDNPTSKHPHGVGDAVRDDVQASIIIEGIINQIEGEDK